VVKSAFMPSSKLSATVFVFLIYLISKGLIIH
jgi:hypothetical protein